MRPRDHAGPAALRRWIGVAAVDLALHVSVPNSLRLPLPWHPVALVDAARSLDPSLAVVAVSHLVLTLLGAYLLALATLGVVLSLHSPLISGLIRPLVRLALVVSVPGTRTVVIWALGLASFSVPLAVTSSFAATPGGPANQPPTMTWVGPPAPAPSTHMAGTKRAGPTPERASDATPSLTPSATSSPSTTTPPATTTPATTTPATVAPAKAIPVPPLSAGQASPPANASNASAGPPIRTSIPQTWTVQPGDHLWSIAARTLTAALPENPPDEAAIATYWWQLVTLNRPHLPNPADIDLLYPGDVVTLPPVP